MMRTAICTLGLVLALNGISAASFPFQPTAFAMIHKPIMANAEQKANTEDVAFAGEALLLEATYDAAEKWIEFTFDRPISGSMANTYGVIGISADNGGSKTLWIKTPWNIGEAKDTRKAVVFVEGEQARIIESWFGSALMIQMESAVFKTADSDRGNFSVSFSEEIRMQVRPAPTGLR